MPISSVAKEDSSKAKNTTAKAARDTFTGSACERTRRPTSGRAKPIMIPVYASAITAVSKPEEAEALTKLTTNARRHHAVTSSTAAHAIANKPIGVVDMPRSARMRTKTGNAVTDMAAPQKRANAAKGA